MPELEALLKLARERAIITENEVGSIENLACGNRHAPDPRLTREVLQRIADEHSVLFAC